MMSTLSKIKQAGFEVSLSGDGFDITPANKLTTSQREFLKENKAEIIKELRAEQAANEIIHNLTVKCYSPNGRCYEVEAKNEEHAKYLEKVNPKPESKHE